MLVSQGRKLHQVALIGVALIVGVQPGRTAEPSAKSKEPPKSLTMVRWGSSSSGMLEKSMDRLLGDRLKITYKPSGVWFRADWLSKDIESGKTDEYEKFLERTGGFSQKAGKYDYGLVQINGYILSSPATEKHVDRILDDMCNIIKKAGATPLIFEHWTNGDQAKVRLHALYAAQTHGAKVAFCGSASAEVIAEKGKKYIGGGGGHTNSRGLYLWTCCMYATLTGNSPIGLPVPLGKAAVGIPAPKPQEAKGRDPDQGGGPEEVVEVTKDDAAYLQRKAWEAHQKYSKLLEKQAK